MSKVYNFDLYRNGAWVEAQTTEKDTIYSPTDGSEVGTVPVAGAADAIAALEAATAAQPAWGRLPAIQRAKVLHAFCAEIRANAEELAQLITREQGKLLKVARFEVEVTCSFMEYAAAHARHLEGNIVPSDNPDEQLLIHRVPRGVVVAITAWNFPLALAGRKIGPALVTGNAVVLKPTPAAPLATLALCDLAKKAGVPDGILNMVTGDVEAGKILVESPLTKMVTMTGSTPTGQAIARSAAQNLTHVQLELGGKAPCIVFADADIDQAVAGALHSRFDNYGQVCTCNERMYVEEEIYDAFMEKFLAEVDKLKLGYPEEEDTDLGPLTEARSVTNLERLVAITVEQGGRITRGGARPKGERFAKGHFFEATVIEDVTQGMDIVHDELFGPVLPVIKFKGYDQAMAYANDCEYGLAAMVFTKDLNKIMRLHQDLEFGEIYINRGHGELHQGFHNGLKLSGTGGEDGRYGLDQYMEKKTTYLKY
ncbi:aldehyde dehydrogenase family protein [Neolewinella aurantiaca]|uniref:Aldehyde dehydrogenase family protein n=1 Tax=Neolewinella aurantiaca TaxID=2602767 RepID=A0A5C7FT37_9BACT|nr:aldehyde dehydrogenase family protein [Neolewinella aurantiaca]TXF87911.1 aldehyde dehydrogenase family protein [Neolewinella aurantiaca]